MLASGSEVKGKKGDFSLISTSISCDPAMLLLLSLHWASPLGFPTVGPFGLLRSPFAPEPIQQQDHEPHQRLPPTPLVSHLLQQPNQPVGPLHMIVGPHTLAHRVAQVRHHLRELRRL